MRKITLLLATVGIMLTAAYSGDCAWISVGPGQAPSLNVEDSDQSGLTFTLDFPGLYAQIADTLGHTFERLSFDGYGSWGELGGPDLPVLRKLVMLPDRAGWHWEVTHADWVELTGYVPAPLQDETEESPAGPVRKSFQYNEISYQQNRWLPGDLVELDTPAISHGYRLGRIELRPVQYNPATGVLRVCKRMTVQVRFEGEGANPIEHPKQYKSRVFQKLYKSMVLNPDIDNTDGVLGGYLFITPPAFEASLNEMLVTWKQQKGFPCTVANTNQTGSTKESIKAYIQNIYNNWPVPPDYVIFVGDYDQGMDTYFYTNLSYQNEQCPTDLPYTLLEGFDYFPDMLAGRLSIDTDAQLRTLCNKIRSYEKTPFLMDSTWFQRGLVVFDYGSFGSSYSCRTTNLAIRDIMLQHGYTAVDTVPNPPYQSGSGPINSSINQGVTFVNYRGFGAYTGWTPPNYYNPDMQGLNNGFKLPVITSIVCGGGAFTVSDPCFGENWIRLGTEWTPAGAVSFIGPSSLHTHTRWNNTIDGGIYQGIFAEGIGDLGSALLRGKMELYFNMPYNQQQGGGGTLTSVECYFNIYNILGDPGLEMWTGKPAALAVTHPTTVAQGVNAFPVTVMKNGAPQQGALVSVFALNHNFQDTAWTNANGLAQMNLEGAIAGSYTVTVTGHDLRTVCDTIAITQAAVALGLDSLHVDDDMVSPSQGDNDGQLNPGETIQLRVWLKNTGSSQTATSVAATISAPDPYLTITQASAIGPNAEPGAVSQLTSDFILHVSSEAPDGHTFQISLVASSAQGSWNNLIELPVVAPLAQCIWYRVASGYLNPGQTSNVSLDLLNSGSDPLTTPTGVLSSLDPKVTVTDANGSWSTLAPGAAGFNTGNPFALSAAYNCPPGWVANLRLIVNSGLYADTMIVPFTVGQVLATDPAGPDQYGYRCFDSRDTAYAQIPVYNWIEASTMPGQETLNLPDGGEEQDKRVIHSLPFTFRFYGHDYNRITICSNGWLSMDSTDYTYFRNQTIPGFMAPPNMVAPFWDDLLTNSPSSVNYWYDSANHRVVVEWKDVRTYFGLGTNRFEAILCDPAYYPTTTGDGEIIFQYSAFANVDNQENYCTIGIENQTREDGVKVTFANYYSPGSAAITPGTALKFTTNITYVPGVPPVHVTLTPVNPPIVIPAQGGSFNYNVQVSNQGNNPITTAIWFKLRMPNGTYLGPVLGPLTLSLSAHFVGNRIRSQSIPGSYPAGSYLYCAYVGMYPDSIWDQSNFPFSKSSTLTGGPWVAELSNTGDPFEAWMTGAQAATPATYSLNQVVPNPFNPATSISYQMPEATQVSLKVYDSSGRLVSTLVNGWQAAGTHQITFDGSKLASGLYFVKMEAGSYTAVQKMMLLK